MKKSKIDNYAGLFKNTQNEELVRVLSFHMEVGKETTIKYEYLENGSQYDLDEPSFNKYFKKTNDVGYIGFNNKGVTVKNNVNQDILKLIEAGYEFTSFFGDTVDGRSFSVDLNEEE